MPSFDIVKSSQVSNSFRSRAIVDRYDLSGSKLEERFTGSIDIDFDWNVGIIVGPSGTGKSTIAKDVFGYTEPTIDNGVPVVELFSGHDLSDVENVLRNVGFSSVPSWLKPFGVLSNGERMRVELALALLSDDEPIIFDEFTSVVDRQIAQIGSLATQKAVRKTGKKFIAIACHYDIIDWLEPDWVFDTKIMTFQDTRGLLQRPEINFRIHKAKGFWHMFAKYHYLDGSCPSSAAQYIGVVDDNPVAFIAVMHFPHPRARNIKRVSRIVVHPEWQGVGIGRVLLEEVGNMYIDSGYRYRIVTSNPILSHFFNKSTSWKIDRVSRSPKNEGKLKGLNNTVRSKTRTIAAEYRGG